MKHPPTTPPPQLAGSPADPTRKQPMDLHARLALAWRHLGDADRDEVVALAEDLAADRQSWWNARARQREEAPDPAP